VSFERRLRTMIKFQKTVNINALPEKIFAYVTDPKDLPEIWPSLIEVKDVKQSPGGVGSTYHWTYKMAGVRFEGNSETTEYVANQRFVVKDKGGIESTRTTTLQRDNGGTKYSVEVEYSVPIPLVGKLAETFIEKQNEHEAEVFLANLKSRMEV
jgi:uncharacterized protein YndB with AHSA1/START domain